GRPYQVPAYGQWRPQASGFEKGLLKRKQQSPPCRSMASGLIKGSSAFKYKSKSGSRSKNSRKQSVLSTARRKKGLAINIFNVQNSRRFRLISQSSICRGCKSVSCEYSRLGDTGLLNMLRHRATGSNG